SAATDSASPPKEMDPQERTLASSEIALGSSATISDLVVAVSFSEWAAGRSLLVEGGVVDDRAADRLERAVIRFQGDAMAGSLDVNSRRLPAALGLHWSGWERLGLGRWRDPDSQIVAEIPRSGAWDVHRGREITEPIEELIAGRTVHALASAATPPRGESVPVVIWARGVSIEGIPSRLMPSRLVAIAVPGELDDELLIHGALPFSTEQDAQVAMVAMRLLLPRVLQEYGIERGVGFDISRTDTELYLVNLSLPISRLTDIFGEGEGQ
ncbi:MAG: hypothetical protein ACOCYB_07455, partial [Alkalispirochaeta sp.]